MSYLNAWGFVEPVDYSPIHNLITDLNLSGWEIEGELAQ